MNTHLRQRFIDYLVLQRYSERTIEAYLQAVNALARHYNKSPDTLTNQQVQDYLICLLREKKLAWASCNVRFTAMNHFFHKFLNRKVCDFRIPPRPRQRKLPQVLSREEVLAIIEAGKDIRHRALLSMTYGSGLRVSEVVCLRIEHIESGRSLVRVEDGKGHKDRYTLLSAKALEDVRLYWKCFRPTSYLFFGKHKDMPMSITTAQRIYNRARHTAGITKGSGIHTLRHCFATHLLEQGVDVYHIQRFLGHRSINTTMVYFHIRPDRLLTIQSPLDLADAGQKEGGHDPAQI